MVVSSNKTQTSYFENEKKLDIIVESGAHCVILTYNNDETDALTLTADVKHDATLSIFQIILSSNPFVINNHLVLTEKEAKVTILSVCLSDSELISNINIEHLAPYTSSVLETYAIGKSSAIMTLNNNTYINQGMVKASVIQKARGLTLDTDAKIVACPNLYISECDVKANHMAAIGTISQDELFYMMSRGLSYGEALKMYVMGFVNPLIDHIDCFEEQKESLRKAFSQKLK